MYSIHVGFGVRSFPPEHFKMSTLILQKTKTKKEQERRKQRRQNNKKANDIRLKKDKNPTNLE